jgi:hypothetical protein
MTPIDLSILFILTLFGIILIITVAPQLDRTTFSLISAGGTVFLAMATAYLALMGNRQLSVMESDQRAWVSAHNIRVGDLKWKDEEARFTVLFNLKNTGRSPGLSVFVNVAADPSPLFTELVAKKHNEMSEAGRNRPSIWGTMVFPGDDIPQAQNIPLSRADIERFQQEAISKAGQRMSVVPATILIVIDYRFAERSDHHPNWIHAEARVS